MTEIEETVERVARAIHQERFGGRLEWGRYLNTDDECRNEARAAIAAIVATGQPCGVCGCAVYALPSSALPTPEALK